MILKHIAITVRISIRVVKGPLTLDPSRAAHETQFVLKESYLYQAKSGFRISAPDDGA